MASTSPSPTVPEFTLGDRLRKARHVADMTADELADTLEVSARTINNYERDKTPVKRKDVALWAMRTGVSFEWLWSGIADQGDDDGGSRVTLRRTDNVRHLQIAA